MTGERQDVEHVVDFVAAVLRAPDPRDPWPIALEQLSLAMRATIAGSARFSADAAQWVHLWTADRPHPRSGFGVEDRHAIRSHPHVRHYSRTGDREPRTISDIVEDRVWRSTAAYDHCRATFGSVWQLSIPVTYTPPLLVVNLGRPDRDFTDGDRELARRLAPVLAGLHHHLQALEQSRRSTGTAPDDAAARAGEHGLTPREVVVLRLLSGGLTAEAIGRRLAISPRTAQHHLERIYRKLGVHDRLMAVLRGKHLGLLEQDRDDADDAPVTTYL